MSEVIPDVYIEMPSFNEPLELPDFIDNDTPRYTRLDFMEMVGRKPTEEEHVSMNCEFQGFVGHLLCGVCPYHEVPRMVCGCLAPISGIEAGPHPAVRVRSRESIVVIEIERIRGLPIIPGLDQLFKECMYSIISDHLLESIEYRIRTLLTRYIVEGHIFRESPDNYFMYLPRRNTDGEIDGCDLEMMQEEAAARFLRKIGLSVRGECDDGKPSGEVCSICGGRGVIDDDFLGIEEPCPECGED